MIKVGDIIMVEVVSLISYGVFVKYEDYDGLIHVSELSSGYVKDIEAYLQIGDKLNVYVLEINEENKQLKLSYAKVPNKHNIIYPNLSPGFEPLEEGLEEWMEDYNTKKENEK